MSYYHRGSYYRAGAYYHRGGFFDDVLSVVGTAGKALLPVAGTAVGSIFGGPVGGVVGGALGAGLASALQPAKTAAAQVTACVIGRPAETAGRAWGPRARRRSRA